MSPPPSLSLSLSLFTKIPSTDQATDRTISECDEALKQGPWVVVRAYGWVAG